MSALLLGRSYVRCSSASAAVGTRGFVVVVVVGAAPLPLPRPLRGVGVGAALRGVCSRLDDVESV